MNRSTAKSVSIAALVIGICTAFPATAQDAPSAGGIADIVVTAQRRPERLQDVPTSLTAFTAETLESARIQDISDVFERTPNVNFASEGGSLRQFISIRGIQNLGGVVNPIGIYVDDLNVAPGFSSRQVDSQFLDIEQVEVLRGPQGTFFGRNTSGGAIVITTKKPGNDFSAELTADAGNNATFLGKLSVNVPLIKDRLAVRLTAFGRRTDGFMTNQTVPENDDYEEVYGGRVAVRITPSDRLTIDLTGQFARTRAGLQRLVATGDPYGQLFPQIGLDPFDPTGRGFYPENNDTVAWNFPGKQRNSNYVVTGRVNYSFETVEVVSITGYALNKFFETLDVDMTPLDLLDRRLGGRTENYSQELRLQSIGDQRFTWLIGGIYFYDKVGERPNDAIAGFDAFGLNPTLPGGEFESFGPRRIAILDSRTTDRYRGWALYANGRYDITDQLGIQVGLRYSETRIKQLFQNGQTDFDPDSPTFLGIIYPEVSDRASYDDFSPMISLTYKASDEVTTYATVSKGFKEGGLNLRALGEGPLPRDELVYQPEKLWNYEIGIKANALDRRLRANLSVFVMKWTDLQLGDFSPTNPLILLTANAAKATSKGFELEVTALPVEDIQIGAAIGYLDAEFDRYDSANLGSGTVANVANTRIQRTPKWTFSADAQYNVPLSTDMDGFVRAEYQYVGNYFFAYEVEPSYRIPSRQTVNVRAGIETERFSLTAYVENLFGDQYITGITPSGGFTLVGNVAAVVYDKPQFGLRGVVRF